MGTFYLPSAAINQHTELLTTNSDIYCEEVVVVNLAIRESLLCALCFAVDKGSVVDKPLYRQKVQELSDCGFIAASKRERAALRFQTEGIRTNDCPIF